MQSLHKTTQETQCSPDSFGDGSRGFLTDEHVASESLQGGMFCDEAEVAMIARMKRAKRNILQGVEVVVTGTLTFLQRHVCVSIIKT